MKRHSIPYFTWELQTQIMKYHYTHIRMAKIQNNNNIKCCQECGKNKKSLSILVRLKNGTASLEDSVALSYKTKHTVTTQHSKCAPCYLLKEVENIHPHQNLHMDVVLPITVTTSQQPVCLSVGEWINKLWYIQTIK